MARIDREELLARIDLPALASDLCGPPRGSGHSARWHCPNPEHPDEHPSMSLYTRNTVQRWKCHACGEGGTAIDLLMIAQTLTAGDAIHHLARQTGLADSVAAPNQTRLAPPAPAPAPRPAAGRRRPAPAARAAEPEPVREPSPQIEQFVTTATAWLWHPERGATARRHLTERGFGEDLLRVNRVGFDPGGTVLPRPKGLPYRGPGIVYPVLNPAGHAIYYQVRTLSPRDGAHRKYDQPTTAMAPNPHLAPVRTLEPAASAVIAITEGIPDALTAAHAGLNAVALLGVSHALSARADTLADTILREHPAPGYLMCLDPDPAGIPAATRLADLLTQRGATIADLRPPSDLNDWWQTDHNTVIRHLTDTCAVLEL